MAPTPKEIVLECCDGMKVAAQKWEVKSVSNSSNGGISGIGFPRHPYGGMMLINDKGGVYGGGYGGVIIGSCNEDGSPVATTKKTRILCIHGLYDNCRSFHYLGRNLVDNLLSKQSSGYTNDTYEIEVVAIDSPGHGKSTNRSLDVAGTTFFEKIFYIAEAIKQLKWDKDEKGTIIGHSFGGSLVLAYAATFPERVEKILLLDRGMLY
jgi:pimeloyl-ACP methyl ester carboxylesterase